MVNAPASTSSCLEQPWRRHLIGLQHAIGMPQADQYQRESELVGLPTALRDKR
jgi:hypothetical protein